MKDVIIDCEIGKRLHQYHLLIKNSLKAFAEKSGFPLGYLSKVEHFGHSPPDAMLNPISEQVGIFVSVIPSKEFILNGIFDHSTKP